MSSRTKVLIVSLVAVIVILAAFAALLSASNSNTQKDRDELITRIQMNTLLDFGQGSVQHEIERVRNLTYALAQELGRTGLNGSDARQKINATLALNPYAIDILTFNTTGIVQAIEPEQYRYMEGVDLGTGNKTKELLNDKVPTMSDTFAARGIARGSGYACPVFDDDGVFLGAVSTLYSVSALMDAVLPQWVNGTQLTWFAMQLDGTIIYDADESQIGLNTFTDPAFANYTELLHLAHASVDYPYGNGIYSFETELGSKQVVSKELVWNTVGAETIQWRIFIVHTL